MDDLYYTPKLKEFCVGFEFEVFNKEEYDPNFMYLVAPDTEGEWFKDTYPSKWLGYSLNEIIKKPIRVKYLDKEDLYELGWKDGKYSNMFTLSKDYLECRKDYTIEIFPQQMIITCREYIQNARYFSAPIPKILFTGIVKNKTELRKLMEYVLIC